MGCDENDGDCDDDGRGSKYRGNKDGRNCTERPIPTALLVTELRNVVVHPAAAVAGVSERNVANGGAIENAMVPR
jgi:hypothetical protein